jgi:hypothetical protein
VCVENLFDRHHSFGVSLLLSRSFVCVFERGRGGILRLSVLGRVDQQFQTEPLHNKKT